MTWVCRWCGQKWPARTKREAVKKHQMSLKVHPLEISCSPTDETLEKFKELYPNREIREYP